MMLILQWFDTKWVSNISLLILLQIYKPVKLHAEPPSASCSLYIWRSKNSSIYQQALAPNILHHQSLHYWPTKDWDQNVSKLLLIRKNNKIQMMKIRVEIIKFIVPWSSAEVFQLCMLLCLQNHALVSFRKVSEFETSTSDYHLYSS